MHQPRLSLVCAIALSCLLAAAKGDSGDSKGKGSTKDLKCPPVAFDHWHLKLSLPPKKCYAPGDTVDLKWDVLKDPTGSTTRNSSAVEMGANCWLAAARARSYLSFIHDGVRAGTVCAMDKSATFTFPTPPPGHEPLPLPCGLYALQTGHKGMKKLEGEVPSLADIMDGKGFNFSTTC